MGTKTRHFAPLIPVSLDDVVPVDYFYPDSNPCKSQDSVGEIGTIIWVGKRSKNMDFRQRGRTALSGGGLIETLLPSLTSKIPRPRHFASSSRSVYRTVDRNPLSPVRCSSAP